VTVSGAREEKCNGIYVIGGASLRELGPNRSPASGDPHARIFACPA
jgi:hypothetical protein